VGSFYAVTHEEESSKPIEESSAWKIGRENDRFNSDVERKY
jgi:hypothetical protein